MKNMTFDDLRRILTDCAGGTDLFERDAAEGAAPLDEPFDELGYDSLALIESAAWIEREFGVDVPDEEITEARTPRALLALVNLGLDDGAGDPAYDWVEDGVEHGVEHGVERHAAAGPAPRRGREADPAAPAAATA